jgi:hypothetical protein
LSSADSKAIGSTIPPPDLETDAPADPQALPSSYLETDGVAHREAHIASNTASDL